MSIRKIKGLESDFTIVPNKAINDKLSWAARGMLLYLCSKPDDWEVNITDLVKQTTGSAKRSGRDAVRSIMKELIECGYMRKSQKNIKGVFQNADHEVSFLPFTENPYTVHPSTVHPTQQSTDITKYGINKESNTEHFSKEKRIDVFSLDGYEYCKEAYRFLKLCKINAENLYKGPLTIEQWDLCEDKLKEVLSSPEEVDTLIMNIHRDRKMWKKKSISLPYILMAFTDTEEFSHIALNCSDWLE
ncbi:hypothetical protein VPH209E381_0034 [Vibrio phage 209E38-1]